MKYEFYRLVYDYTNDKVEMKEVESDESIKTNRKVSVTLNRNAMLDLLMTAEKFKHHLQVRGLNKCQFCGKQDNDLTPIVDNETLTEVWICRACYGEDKEVDNYLHEGYDRARDDKADADEREEIIENVVKITTERLMDYPLKEPSSKADKKAKVLRCWGK